MLKSPHDSSTETHQGGRRHTGNSTAALTSSDEATLAHGSDLQTIASHTERRRSNDDAGTLEGSTTTP